MTNTKPTIFISLCRNFSIRYILYTDIFRELQKKARIVLFFKESCLDYYREKLRNEDVILEPMLYRELDEESRKRGLESFFHLIRKCVSGSREDMENTTDQARLYQHGKLLKKRWLGWLEFQFVYFFAIFGKKYLWLRRTLVAVESFCFPGKQYDAYFEKYKPQMLLVSSIGSNIDPWFMRAAKRYGCKVTSIVFSWDNPSTKDYRGGPVDHVIVWNDQMKREIEVFHDVPEERIFTGGIAHWDFYFNPSWTPTPKADFLKQHGLKEGRKLLFYGSSSNRIFRKTFDVLECLLREIRSGRFGEPVQLLVRLHPNYLRKQPGREGQVVDLYRKRMDAIQSEFGELIAWNLPKMIFLKSDIDMPVEDMFLLGDILHHCDLLLTEFSTLMIEGAIFDKPIVNVALHHYRDTGKPASFLETFTHLRRILQTGACSNVYTESQLFETIASYLKNPSLNRAERKRLTDQEIPVNRGCAATKIGEYLVNILKDGSR